MGVYSITNNNLVIHPKGTSQQMDQGDFLRLMTAQLSQQDPFNPVDNQQMVAQMAQFSSLAGISGSAKRWFQACLPESSCTSS